MAKAKKKAHPFRNLTLILVIIVALAWGYYYKTGQDPTGLVERSKTTIENLLKKYLPIGDDKSDTKKSGPVTTPVSGSGDWWEVYFTDPHNHGDYKKIENSVAEKLIQYINSAKKKIHIASFEFNLTPVAEALIAAKNKGVQVQWVTDNEHGLEADEEDGHGQFAMLQKAGIGVRADTRGALMHNKFWIFDGEVVWTGSTNITKNGMFRNNNNIIVLKSPAAAEIYEREFQEMWGGSFGPKSQSDIEKQKLDLGGTPVQILFAPEDNVPEVIIPILKSAEKSVKFMAFSFTHDGMGDALLSRMKAGVEVMGIFETRGSETKYSELGRLGKAGAMVRQDGNPRTFHHKVFIVDEKTVVTGSFNFSKNASESNDENMVIITHPEIAKQYLMEFDRRWAEANDPPKDVIM